MSNGKNEAMTPNHAFRLADDYLFGKNGKEQNVKEALKYYNIAAKQGLSEAQYTLGIYYYNGTGVSQNYERAVFWLEKAAEQEHPKALLHLAQCYEDGTGTEQNQKRALALYEQAALLGEAEANFAASRIKQSIEEARGAAEIRAVGGTSTGEKKAVCACTRVSCAKSERIGPITHSKCC